MCTICTATYQFYTLTTQSASTQTLPDLGHTEHDHHHDHLHEDDTYWTVQEVSWAEAVAAGLDGADPGPGAALDVPETADATDLAPETPGFLANSFADARATVTVEETEDVAGDQTTSASITLNQVFSGTIGPFGGDVDAIAVTLQAGELYQFNVLGQIGAGGSLADPAILAILDPDGNPISGTFDDDTNAKNPELFFTPEQTGTYYVQVSNSPNAPTQVGSYTLEVKSLGGDVSATINTTAQVGVDDTLVGALNAVPVGVDEDYVRVELEAGRTYIVELLGGENSRGTIDTPQVTGIFNSLGGQVVAARSGGSSSNVQIFFSPEESGTFYVGVSSTTAEVGSYVLSVRDDGLAAGPDIAANISTTASTQVGVPFVSNINIDGAGVNDTDVDWVAIELQAGVTYQIDQRGAPRSIGGDQPPTDLNLTDANIVGIFDSNGIRVQPSVADLAPLSSIDDGGAGTDSRLIFTPLTSGTYYIALSAFDNVADFGTINQREIESTEDTGFYELLITERLPDVSPVDDYSATPNDLPPLRAGDSLTGAINTPGDADAIPVAVTAGDTILITVAAGDGQTLALDNPFLQILDADGNEIPFAFNDNRSTYDAELEFTPTEDGIVFVRVTSSIGMGSATEQGVGREEFDTGSYTVSITDIADRSSDDLAVSPYNVADGETVSDRPLTGNPTTDAFNAGEAYAENSDGSALQLAYSFTTPGSQLSDQFAGNRDDTYLYEFNAVQQAMARDAIAQLESFLNIDFVEVEDDGTANQSGIFRFGWSSEERPNVAGLAFLPVNTSSETSDIFIISSVQGEEDFAGSFLHLTIIHELGHAVGLQHPFDDDNTSTDDNNFLPDTQANVFLTVMTNNADLPDGTPLDFLDLYPQSYMYLDILALQELYGAVATRTGDDVYSFSGENRYFLTLWDNGGTDEIRITDVSSDLSINLAPDSWVNVGTTINAFRSGRLAERVTDTVYIPPEVTVENLTTSSGDDTLMGNSASNQLVAGAGNDMLMGATTIDSAADRDTLVGESGRDTLDGMQGDDLLSGGNDNDSLTGDAGDDQVFGGAGDDSLSGGAGDDTLFAGAGSDRVIAGSGDDLLFGGAGDDDLLGGPGNDTLDGGLGDDTLNAGDGFDLIRLSAGQDIIRGLGSDDTLDVSRFGFATMEDLLDASETTVNGLMITDGAGNSVLIAGLGIDDLASLTIVL